jgi:hypothetical protein
MELETIFYNFLLKQININIIKKDKHAVKFTDKWRNSKNIWSSSNNPIFTKNLCKF